MLPSLVRPRRATWATVSSSSFHGSVATVRTASAPASRTACGYGRAGATVRASGATNSMISAGTR
ncbi:hypothetical protein ACFQ60_45820 [Streptomyces zhihengii]